jgi:hypothetical protein
LLLDIIVAHIFFSLALQPPWALASAFQFHDHFTDSRTPWTSDQLVARPLPKHRTTQTQNKHIHTPNIHALCGIRTYDPGFRASEDHSATVTGCSTYALEFSLTYYPLDLLISYWYSLFAVGFTAILCMVCFYLLVPFCLLWTGTSFVVCFVWYGSCCWVCMCVSQIKIKFILHLL